MAIGITTIPLIPLALDTVLLPGIILRIPVDKNRPDIPALLSDVYAKAAGKTESQKLDNVHVACVPLASPLLGKNGQGLISDKEHRGVKPGAKFLDPASATKDDLFEYATAAKISGVEGRGTGEFALLVEGIARVRINKVIREKPFFEGEVTYLYDAGESQHPLYNFVLCS